ncbi:hypothetical protein HPB50_019555 [Hyalomma asiaticum]|uniref:Uncharacterized protein n=1 Tax=Hyalomma asiaticum TaxID=266040 RepID=A0ACB7RQ29_HYAAI|nr:hypothetical protein HPB50_019555 [Hyalomma asiaticum]
MGEDMRTHVLQQETTEWLRPQVVAKLAQKYDESTGRIRSGIPAAASSKNSERFNCRPADRPPECYRCGENGHYRWQCPQTTPKATAAEGEKIRSPPEKLIAWAACEPTTECAIPTTERASRSRLTWVELVSAGRKFKACLDSGSEITVLREGLIPTEATLKGVEKAREETHGMSIRGGLLYHRELLSERQCHESVVRETRREDVFAPAHGAPSDEHCSGNVVNELVRSALSRETTSDTGRHLKERRIPRVLGVNSSHKASNK